MKKVLIQRIAEESGDWGTFGKLSSDDGMFECYTLEPPWRDLDKDGKRDPNISRIAPWKGMVKWTQSAHRKNPDGSREWSFVLIDVPDVEGMRIHAGNFAGDRSRGYASDSEACILLGRAILEMEIPQHKKERQVWINRATQKGVSSSHETVEAFVAYMGKDPFELTIKDA